MVSGTGGYSSLAGFIPSSDRAIVVLYDRDNLVPAARIRGPCRWKISAS